MLRATGKLFSFNEKSCYGDWVERTSFMKVLNSRAFQKKLERHILIGCLTHKRRDDALNDQTSIVPVADWLLAEGEDCNYITKVWVEGDICYFEMVIMDNENGKEVQRKIIQDKMDLLPSVVFSVEDPNTKRMVILDILAVDLTTNPAFSTTFKVEEVS